RDLGFDSLERAELLLRLERAFNVRLPARTLMTTETPRDLVRAVRAGSISLPPASAVAPTPVAKPAVAIPERAATLVDVLRWHANTPPLRTHLTFLVETEEAPLEARLESRDG